MGASERTHMRLDTAESHVRADLMGLSYDYAKQVRDRWDRESSQASAILQTYESGKFGLTPDAVKQSPAYRRDKRHFDNAFANLRHWNQLIQRHFPDEVKQDRARHRRR